MIFERFKTISQMISGKNFLKPYREVFRKQLMLEFVMGIWRQ
jgi:hypothetical protein